MKETHTEALKQFYACLAEGNPSKALEVCAENMSFQIAGKGPVAGKYTRSNFADGLIQKLQSLTDGTYQFQVHDIIASDLHGTILGTEKFTFKGKTHELRTVHVWRFENGKPLAGYLYARDLYASDAAFSG